MELGDFHSRQTAGVWTNLRQTRATPREPLCSKTPECCCHRSDPQLRKTTQGHPGGRAIPVDADLAIRAVTRAEDAGVSLSYARLSGNQHFPNDNAPNFSSAKRCRPVLAWTIPAWAGLVVPTHTVWPNPNSRIGMKPSADWHPRNAAEVGLRKLVAMRCRTSDPDLHLQGKRERLTELAEPTQQISTCRFWSSGLNHTVRPIFQNPDSLPQADIPYFGPLPTNPHNQG